MRTVGVGVNGYGKQVVAIRRILGIGVVQCRVAQESLKKDPMAVRRPGREALMRKGRLECIEARYEVFIRRCNRFWNGGRLGLVEVHDDHVGMARIIHGCALEQDRSSIR